MIRKPMVFEFECDCHAKTGFEFIPPGQFDKPTFESFQCHGCRSTWQMRFRHTTKGLVGTHRLTHGTQKLADVLLKKKVDAIANRPQKKDPIFFMPGLPREEKKEVDG